MLSVVPIELLIRLTKFKAADKQVDRYANSRRLQATLAILDKLDLDSERPSDEEVARMFGYEEAFHAGTLTAWQRLKPKVWALFDEPYSSSSAKVPPNNVHHRNVIINNTNQ